MKRIFAIVLAVAVTTAALLTVWASPGDANDPLVSKSYVDERFNQLLSVLSAHGDASALQQDSASYVPVSVGMGLMLIGSEGTEIILRSGKAVAYCPGENGIVDITTGEEIFSGAEIPANHMLIIPRKDGRGALISEDAWFLVKGGYSIDLP
jgi:hypothetical protein